MYSDMYSEEVDEHLAQNDRPLVTPRDRIWHWYRCRILQIIASGMQNAVEALAIAIG